tara:strand:- start:13235 stop:13525 length:291 start_codon:yes stop_codon:yes gene_type:complete
MLQFDPLSILSIMMIQIGHKHLVLDLTEKQKKMLKHPYMQFIILLSLVYLSTKDIRIAFTIALVIYLVIYVLMNDTNPYSMLIDDLDIDYLYFKNI